MLHRHLCLLRTIAFALVFFIVVEAPAQITSLEVELVTVHSGPVGNSDLTGMSTYRVMAILSSSDDYIGAVYGNQVDPCSVMSTTSFYQHPAGGSFGTDLNIFFLGILPDLNYDSWLTIGLETAPMGSSEEGISSIGMGAELEAFESGLDFLLNSTVGGSWFVLPGSSNGIAGDDLSVLLAQVTTDGLLSGTFNVQCFIGGDPFNEQILTANFAAGAPGCTDLDACNYDEAANADDGSCWFAETGYGCDGACLSDTDGDGICDPFEIEGCTDPLSCNYAEGVTDEVTCLYAQEFFDCDGACLSDQDGDGVCDGLEVSGCLDMEACNYSAAATEDDGSCWFALPHRDCDGACINDLDGDGVCDEEEILGCTDLEADNFATDATDDDGSCAYGGCMESEACNFDPQANVPEACTFAEAGYDCSGICLTDMDGDGICDEFEVAGCTNILAENYDPLATDEDGSCSVLASSYCGAGTVWDALLGQCIGTGEPECIGDFDQDGARTTTDLLTFLSVFGENCE